MSESEGEIRADIIQRLEEAGSTLMESPMPQYGMPAGYKSNWPDIRQSLWDVLGHAEQGGTTGQRAEELQEDKNLTTRLVPSNKAQDRCREAVCWLLYIPTRNHRRTVSARMFRHPVSGKYLHPFGKLSKEWGVEKFTVQRWHALGINAIVERLFGEG